MFDLADFLFEFVAELIARLTGGRRSKALALVAVAALAILLLALVVLATVLL